MQSPNSLNELMNGVTPDQLSLIIKMAKALTNSDEKTSSERLDNSVSTTVECDIGSRVKAVKVVDKKELNKLAVGCVSLIKRTNKWIAQIDLGRNEDGKRRRWTSRHCETSVEAKELLLAKRKLLGIEVNDVSENMRVISDAVSVERLLYKYADFKAKNHESSSRTRNSDRETLSRLMKYFSSIGHPDITLRELDSDICLNCRNYFIEKYSYSVTHKAFIMLKGALNYAVEEGIINRSPMLRIQAPKKKDTESKTPFTMEQLKVIFNAAKDEEMPDNYIYFLVLLYTGMRPGEAQFLKWEDTDFEKEGIIHIKGAQTLDFEDDTIKSVNASTKTAAGIRDVYIESKLFSDILLRWRDYCNSNSLYSRYDGLYVFPSKNREQVSTNCIKQRMADFKRHHALEGVKNFMQYQFRHTLGTEMMIAGANEFVISCTLGHSRKSVTQIYLHDIETLRREFTKKVQSKFDSIIEEVGLPRCL